MSAGVLEFFSKLVFGSSLVLIVYIVYYEIKINRINAEKAIIKLQEMENENKVNSLTPDELVSVINDGVEPNNPKIVLLQKNQPANFDGALVPVEKLKELEIDHLNAALYKTELE